MSKYTVELRHLVATFGQDEVESWFKDYDLKDYLSDAEIEVIEKRGTWTKDKLARKIVNHFMMREIGFETPAYFRNRAIVVMQEIMESKLPMIYTNALEYDMLVNEDYTETYKANDSRNDFTKGSGSGVGFGSDTPQGQIDKQQILSGKYVSNAQASENEQQSSGQSNGNQEYTRHVVGNHGVLATPMSLIKQYRENILQVDKDIINELESIFIGIY